MQSGQMLGAAIILAAPIIVAVLHQRSPGGSAIRPLDPTMLDVYALSFIRA
jgi:hypothetical protein